jgi:hypothetical protein
MSRRRHTRHTIARDSYALALAAPEVVLHRLFRLWLAGDSWSNRDRTEFHRMYAEKAAAFYESWNAMMLEMLRANMRFALSSTSRSWSFPSAQVDRMVTAVLGAGVAPIRRRAVANAKRLRRARL